MSDRLLRLSFCAALLASLLLLSGCGGKHPEVSGKVTYNGEPVPNLKVFFTPSGSKDNPVPGPYSTGVTNESGVYTLQTRNKESGAVVGSHRVGFEWAAFSKDDIDFLRELIKKANDPTKKAKLQEELDEAKAALKSRPKISKTLEFQFQVTADGTGNADFELVK